MNRFFSTFLMAFTAFFVLQAAEVTFDFSSAEGIAAMGYAVPDVGYGTNLTQEGPVTVQGVTLSATDGATATRIWNSQGSYTLRIYVDGTITLTVAEGSITGVTVNAANTSNFDLLADVGDYSVAYPDGSWQPFDGELELLSLDELDTLPKSLLWHVKRLGIAGGQLFDFNRYDIWEDWEHKDRNGNPALQLHDRETNEVTPLTPGVITDLDKLSVLTGLEELYLKLTSETKGGEA